MIYSGFSIEELNAAQEALKQRVDCRVSDKLSIKATEDDVQLMLIDDGATYGMFWEGMKLNLSMFGSLTITSAKGLIKVVLTV